MALFAIWRERNLITMLNIGRFLKKNILQVFCALLILASVALRAESRETAKYIFLFIGDGMGEAQVRAAELYSLAAGEGKLAFNAFPVQGRITTASANAAVTDSAAAGTALASGFKTKNGVLNMNSSLTERYTPVAMTAREGGMKVGIVTSSFLNDATPAAFYAYSPSRTDYYEIGEQLIRSGFDYFAGGGITRKKGRRGDRMDLYDIAGEKGYRVIRTAGELTTAVRGTKVLASGAAGALPYEMDRPGGNPSLAEYTKQGIALLDNPKGFFMMVEGGKIDWACHRNDPAAVIHDLAAFNSAVKEALAFAEHRPRETLIVILADHETGGMTFDGEKAPGDIFAVLSAQRESSEAFDGKIADFRKESQRTFERMLPRIAESFGLHASSGEGGAPFLALSAGELNELRAAFVQSMQPKEQRKKDREYLHRYGPYEPLSTTATRILGRKTGIGWATFGHTGASVPVFARGKGAELFAGEYDNTEVARKLMSLLPFPKTASNILSKSGLKQMDRTQEEK